VPVGVAIPYLDKMTQLEYIDPSKGGRPLMPHLVKKPRTMPGLSGQVSD
jgi:hypothetical protein